jgi:bifunctional enzyme CysN/CysC
MPWLEAVEVDEFRMQHAPFRLPVQWVIRPNLDFRGFAGTIAAGTVKPGDRVRVLPSGRESTVTRIVTYNGDLPLAVAGQSITLTLADEIDISRGDVICTAASPAEVADQFETTLVWMHDDPLLVGRQYWLKIGGTTVPVQVTDLKYRINVNTLEHLAAKTLALNEIGVANIGLDKPIAFDPYSQNRDTGGFILIARMTNATVGAGMIHFALRRAPNIHVQAVDVNKSVRATLMGQQPCVLWFTGLSGAGK